MMKNGIPVQGDFLWEPTGLEVALKDDEWQGCVKAKDVTVLHSWCLHMLHTEAKLNVPEIKKS